MKSKLYNLGLAFVIFIFLNMLVTTILFVFNISITKFNFLISLILTLFIYGIIIRKYKWKEIIGYLTIFLLTIFFSTFIAEKMYDVSADGSNYHKAAIGELKNGWNPLRESFDDFTFSNEKTGTNSIWTDHYAKGYWIYSANVYEITDNIESGKGMVFITIVATFLLCFSFISNKLSTGASIFISILLAINPILIYQIPTYYNDGLLGAYLIILVISLFKMADKKENIKEALFLYFLTLCILINIKFTGFVFAGIYSLAFFLYFIVKKEHRQRIIKKLILVGGAALIFGVGIIGSSTYYKNYIDHDHPFYPLYGPGKVDIMYHTTPVGLPELNRAERFLVSNFSKTYNVGNDQGEPLYEIKIPFTFNVSEINEFRYSDVRVGGYGVLFGGILIISIVAGLIVLYRIFKEKFDELFIFIIPILATFFLIIILKDSWWARYVPQLYAMPLIVCYALLRLDKNNKFYKNTALLILIFLTVNAYLIVNPMIEEVKFQSDQIREENEIFKDISPEETILVYNPRFEGAIFNVRDLHKNIEIINNNENLEGYKEYNHLGNIIRTKIYIKESGK